MDENWAAVRGAPEIVLILLDTNALIWLHRGHRRAAPLLGASRRLYVSPASLLELEFLIEAARLRLKPGVAVTDLAADEHWLLDDPASSAWFTQAITVSWTRDPFDRLLVAHAQLRGWRLATGDTALLEHLDPSACVEL